MHPFAGRDVNWLVDFRAESRPDHPFLLGNPSTGGCLVWTYREFRQRVLESPPA